MTDAESPRSDFIRDIIDADLASGKHRSIVTRFPPEPNGYLHIGHAKAICLNFGLAEQYGGRCHLRFDDTNPLTEETEYETSIQEDVRWLGFSWGEHLHHSSDYFERLYLYAEELIEKGRAYVCSLTEEEMRAYRGTVMEPGRPSPDRDQSVEEALALFRRMRAGEFPDGALTLRAKIDMAAANMKMRDPPIYRIRHASHHRAGDAWCIYPMYDFAHCLSDSLEGITHSICTLEFENNRELYDWLLDHLDVPQPQPRQYEFARLNLSYTVMSKRKLLTLVKERKVSGWDDPRMPTLSGLRRRGVTPEAIRAFADDIGVAKANSMMEVERLEYWIRDDLSRRSPRGLAVLNPLKVTIDTLPEDHEEALQAPFWPAEMTVPEGAAHSRKLPFSRTLYIERDDFMEEPVKGFKRLAPGREARLRFAYVIKCERVVKNEAGEVVELICSHEPESKSGSGQTKKVSSTLHWVSAAHAVDCEVRLYDRLFSVENPDGDKEKSFLELLNPDSLAVRTAKVEPSLVELGASAHIQFERLGYFFVDPKSSTPGAPVFNRSAKLRDTWAKQSAEAQSAALREEKRAAKEARKRPRQPTSTKAPLEGRALALHSEHGLTEADARLVGDSDLLFAWFGAAIAHPAQPTSVAKWLVNDVQAALKTKPELPFGGLELGELVALVDGGRLSKSAGKRVFEEMVAHGGRAEEWRERLALNAPASEDALQPLVQTVLAQHPEEVERYRQGKKALMGFFVGQVMKSTQGKADAQQVREQVVRALEQNEG